MRPMLINPNTVMLASLSGMTQMDEHFSEPEEGRESYEQPIPIKAQVKFGRDYVQGGTEAGNVPETRGHLTITRETKLASHVKVGDKLTEIDGQAYDNVFVIEVRAAGHYDTARLFKVYFESRDSISGISQ